MRPRNEIGSRRSSPSAPPLLAAQRPVACDAGGKHDPHLHTRQRRQGRLQARAEERDRHGPANSKKLLAPISDPALCGAFGQRISGHVRPELKQTWIRTDTAISRTAAHRLVRLSEWNPKILPHRHRPERDHHQAETRSRRICCPHNFHQRVCLAPLFAAATMRKTRR